MPFLSVVTRTHERDKDFLSLNQESLAVQSDPDFEQIILRDDANRGLAWANQQFFRHRDKPIGEYVIMLDDDNRFCSEDAIKLLKAVAWDRPDVIMFKADVGCHGILPSDRAWEERKPIPFQVDGHCCVVRTPVWRNYVDQFMVPIQGDVPFFSALWDARVRIEWLNAVLVQAMRVGSMDWEAEVEPPKSKSARTAK